MTTLNTTEKIIKKKSESEEALVLAKAKLVEGVLKVKNQDLELPLKALKVDKCHYIEDYQKEGLTP